MRKVSGNVLINSKHVENFHYFLGTLTTTMTPPPTTCYSLECQKRKWNAVS